MVKHIVFTVILLAGMFAFQMNSAYGDDDTKPNRLGVGAHYWTAVDNIDDDNFDEDGVSWLASYQYWPGLFGIEAAVEWLRDGFGGSEDDVFLPQAYLIFGKWIYAAAGIGGYYTDGRMADDPFYALRAGLNLELLPYLFLDLNANYRFEEWDDLREEGTEIDTDTVTLGGAVRIGF